MEEQLSEEPVLNLNCREIEVRINPDGSLVIPWFSPDSGELVEALWSTLCTNLTPFPVIRISNSRIFCG